MTLRIIDSEFGVGAGDRLGRIEKMYHRVGSDLIREDDHCGGISRLFDVICKLWKMWCDPMIGLMIRLPTKGFLVIAHIASNVFFLYFDVFSGNDIFKEEHPRGSRLAPGYVENLTPVTPFHDVKDC